MLHSAIVLRVLIIADDLTGAADSGVVFRERGMNTVVLLGKPGRNRIDVSDLGSAEVVAVDVDTRYLGAALAEDAVQQLLRSCGDSADSGGDRPLLFKKVDSTLRGNVAVELAAALRARRALIPPTARVGILFAPAFPALGRTTIDGRQMVNGVYLKETDLWRGERTRPHAEIAEMLGEAGLTCATMNLALVRGEANALESAMVGSAKEVDVLACDAETEEDLGAIARAAMVLDEGTIWAGSAGLASHVADAIGLGSAFGSVRAQFCETRVHGPTLFVVGSQAMVSREQADTLADALELDGYRVTANSTFAGKQSQEQVNEITRSLVDCRDVLVRFDPTEAHDNDLDRKIARSVAKMIAPCALHVGALVATGGDTARAILDAWGVQRLTLMGEVAPGLPCSMATCGNREILVLTKAGGFGTRDTLLRCREFVHRFGRDSDAVESRHSAGSRKS